MHNNAGMTTQFGLLGALAVSVQSTTTTLSLSCYPYPPERWFSVHEREAYKSS